MNRLFSKVYMAIFIVITVYGCAKDYQFTVHTKVINNSGTSVRIYVSNTQYADTLHLNSGEEIEMPHWSGPGEIKYFKDKEGIAFPYNRSGELTFIFNKTDTVMHFSDSLIHTGKYLNLMSDRCAFSEAAHTYEATKEKKSVYKMIIYTITTADYEFAKQ